MDKVLEALERLKTAPTFMGGTPEYQACTKSETLLIQDYETVKQFILKAQEKEKWSKENNDGKFDPRMNERIKTISIIFKNSKLKVIMNLDAVLETEIVCAKPYDMPLLIVTYRGLKQDYFSFFTATAAQKLKNAIDEKRDYVILEDII